ncbi:uncharacterized, partial [Tachysurus ichikawai]
MIGGFRHRITTTDPPTGGASPRNP